MSRRIKSNVALSSTATIIFLYGLNTEARFQSRLYTFNYARTLFLIIVRLLEPTPTPIYIYQLVSDRDCAKEPIFVS